MEITFFSLQVADDDEKKKKQVKIGQHYRQDNNSTVFKQRCTKKKALALSDYRAETVE